MFIGLGSIHLALWREKPFNNSCGGTPAARESDRSEVVNKLCWTLPFSLARVRIIDRRV